MRSVEEAAAYLQELHPGKPVLPHDPGDREAACVLLETSVKAFLDGMIRFEQPRCFDTEITITPASNGLYSGPLLVHQGEEVLTESGETKVLFTKEHVLNPGQTLVLQPGTVFCAEGENGRWIHAQIISQPPAKKGDFRIVGDSSAIQL